MSNLSDSSNEPRPGRPPVDASGSAAPPPPPYYAPGYAPAPKQGGILSRLATSLITGLLLFSLGLNLYLGIFVYSSMAQGASESTYIEGDASQRIVILPVIGLIDDSTYTFIHDALDALREDRPAAVILRVDSGGGYVAPSDRIWHELKLFKQETGIPIVASFGSTAASGGYYIAALSDVIVAEPTGITGSIGVIAQAFTFGELLDKVGVTPETIEATRSDKKGMLNPMRAWTEEDRQKMRVILDGAHERFVEVVHEGRQEVLSEEEVWTLASGEVFTADAAVANKLVDQLGYLGDAIEVAKAEAGIAAEGEPLVTTMGQPKGLSLLGMLRSEPPDLSSISGEQVRTWMLELAVPRLEYRAPLGG